MDLEIVHLLLTLNGTQAKCAQIQIQDQSGAIMFLKGNKSPNVEDQILPTVMALRRVL